MQKSKSKKSVGRTYQASKNSPAKSSAPKASKGSQPPQEVPPIEVRIPPSPQLIYDTKTETLHYGAYKEAQKLHFLVALAHYRGVIGPACRAANVRRKTIYDWMEADPLFREAVEIVRQEVGEELEEAAYRKAIDHLDGPMLKFMLAANFQKYRNVEKPQAPLTDDKPEDKSHMAALLTTKVPDGRSMAQALRDTYRSQEGGQA